MEAQLPPLGARRLEGSVSFRVWAPRARSVRLVLEPPRSEEIPMLREEDGYWETTVAGLEAGGGYRYRLDGGAPLADPASSSQPKGVHGPSAIVDPGAYAWSDAAWSPPALAELSFYELHVGTFSPEGTFAGVARQIGEIADLGVRALEIMPFAEFPGSRNWGYDGIFPFAVQHTYGGLSGLQSLVDTSHAHGLAVFADVVYNHIGPEGNRLAEFGPYFTDTYRTPWGAAINFDGPESDHVRHFFLESARYLLRDAHLDGLRVDAVHAIVDPTAEPFLAQLTRAAHAVGAGAGRPVHVVAESALNDPRVLRPEAVGGLGFDATWLDEFHHALHAWLTGESNDYYADFGSVDALRRSLTEAFVLDGRYSIYRRRHFGAPATDLAAERFVAFAQNHDQTGNRRQGERLAALVPPEALRFAAALTILAPYLPLVFMGEEYGERAPFLFFTDHSEPGLIAAVREGRAKDALGEGSTPDPQDPESFARSRLDRARRGREDGRRLLALYRRLFGLRREWGPRPRWSAEEVRTSPDERLLSIGPARTRTGPVLLLFHLRSTQGAVSIPFPPGRWRRALDSGDPDFGGAGAAFPERPEGGRSIARELPPFALAVYAEEAG